MTFLDQNIDYSRAKRNVAVLVAAQALLGSQIAMIFVIGGLAGQQLSPNACLATLPISLIVFGSMTTAPWLSPLMQRFGRQAGFFVGAIGGLIGAGIAALALALGSFWLFVFGSYLTGIYMSAQGFFRFAAIDTAPDDFRPKAISYVMAGGLLSAIIGPQLVSILTVDAPDATVMRFFPVYIAVIGLNLLGIVLFLFLDIPVPKATAGSTRHRRSVVQLLTTPSIAVAVICATISYALMNLVMTSTPLAIVACGFAVSDASNVVTAHVLAMFGPSFFTGHLIGRYGAEKIVATGVLILGCAGLVALAGVALGNFFGALVLLGIGWNFGFIGSTAMLATAHSPDERGFVQGMNDLIVFGGVTVASLASGGLMNCSATSAIEGWSAVNIAMVPFLAFAGASLAWLTFCRKSAQV
ncbi:MAG: MFS transporter [Aestuariivita sp.]|nr:MFS transporter [Aestuariivita sp.]MCY4347540.1 MFS transporter [Aestuariivita sp.]